MKGTPIMWTTFMLNKESPPERRGIWKVGRIGSIRPVLRMEDLAGSPSHKARASSFAPFQNAPASVLRAALKKTGNIRAFTLFELMIVLSIIVILATMGLIGYQAAVPPGAVNAARNELHGLLRFAREQAIVRGSGAMLIMNYDNTDRAKFLRYAGVVVEEEYQSGNWLAAHSGIYLPEGVYFVPQTVDALTDGFGFDALWPADLEAKSVYNCTNAGSGLAIGGVQYPVSQSVVFDSSDPDEVNWIGFQFGPDGRIEKADFSACSVGTGYQNKQLVLGLAEYDAVDVLQFERSEAAVGIVVRLNGVSYAFDDLSEIVSAP